MKIGCIMWGPSQAAALVKAAEPLDFVDLKLWSTRQIKDTRERERCVEALRASDLLLLYPDGSDAWRAVEPEVRDMAKRVPTVCLGHDATLWSISSVAPEVFKGCHEYLTLGGAQNMSRMLSYLAHEVGGLEVEVAKPLPLPWEGIYHPDAPEVFAAFEDYTAWRAPSDGPWVGILFYRSYWVNDNMEIEKAIIREFERHGANVLAVFSQSVGKTDFDTKTSYEVVEEFLLDPDGRARVDAFVCLQSFLVDMNVGVHGPEEGREAGVGLLVRLGVPVFHPVVAYSRTRQEWEEDERGLGGGVGWSVALPEFEGMIEPVIIGTAGREEDAETGVVLERYTPIPERIERMAKRILSWVRLAKKPPAERKVAFILNNSPCAGLELSVGSASKLDSLESVVRILTGMGAEGYTIEDAPADGKALARTIMDRKAISEFRWTTVDEIIRKGGAIATVDLETYRRWFDGFPEDVRTQLRETWGEPPGEELDGVPAAMVHDGEIVITGLRFGNVVVCCQPKRGCAGSKCDGRVCKILHDPEIPPPHQYFAVYRYLEQVFGADVIVHVGTHGSLEFLPGKGVGLSESCYPDLAIHTVPFVYIYNADNPAEGTIAKRRSYAVLTDHMQTVMTEGGLYDELDELERALEEYGRARGVDPARSHVLEHQITELLREAKLEAEVASGNGAPFEEVARLAHEILSRVRDTQIPDGMHVFGERPEGERLVDFACSVLRTDFGDGVSLRGPLARSMGIDLAVALDRPAEIHAPSGRTYGELVKEIDERSRAFVRDAFSEPGTVPREPIMRKLKAKVLDVRRRIEETDEIGSLLGAMGSGYVPPGPSGLITRGRLDVLPTGRNFYSLDPEKIPTRAAYRVGVRLAEALLERHEKETGRTPENLGMVWMASDIMRADGEELSQLMHLIGVRPVWQASGKVTEFEIIPLEELGRPRVDITVRVSGITRDCFPKCIELLDRAIQAVASLPEPPDRNFLRRHALAQINADSPDEATEEVWRDATLRIFCSKAGTYGSGVNLAVYASAWKDEKDLSDIFTYWNGYAYGEGIHGKEAHRQLAHQLSSVDLTFNNACTDETDLFSCCCYFSVQGGMAAAAKTLRGHEIPSYYGDTRDPSRVGVGTLAEEVRRVVRSKLLNPVWIEGMKRHGYKGAGDIAKRVGRVYGWKASTGQVDDWIFDDIARRFALDEENRRFFKENSPWALEEIARRLLEAYERGLWDADPQVLEDLRARYLEIEGWLEEDMGDVRGEYQGGAVSIITSEEVPDWAAKLREVRSKLVELDGETP